MNRVIRAKRAWLPMGLTDDVAIEVDFSGQITCVRPARASDGPALDGLVLPGLINAHTHLAFEGPQAKGGEGFVAWMKSLSPPVSAPSCVRTHAQALFDFGTAWVGEVSPTGEGAETLRNVGLQGVVHHEHLGMDRRFVPEVVASASKPSRHHSRGVWTHPAPHALFSTHPAIVSACLRATPVHLTSTIHVGEAEGEAEFLQHGTGVLAQLLDALGRKWRPFEAPGVAQVETLEALGALGPHMLLVHGITLPAHALRRAARAHAPLCVCPRSNLYIRGALPDLRRWRSLGGRLALGTDSLASSPNLDVLEEIAVLAREIPDLPVTDWLKAATHGGAQAVRAHGLGAIAPGTRPGLLQLDVGKAADLAQGAPARRWIIDPHGRA